MPDSGEKSLQGLPRLDMNREPKGIPGDQRRASRKSRCCVKSGDDKNKRGPLDVHVPKGSVVGTWGTIGGENTSAREKMRLRNFKKWLYKKFLLFRGVPKAFESAGCLSPASIYIHTYTHIHIYTFEYIHICIHTCVCTYRYIHTYIMICI